MRNIFDKAFRPSKIKELEGVVKDTAYDLIDSFIADGSCDWVKQFSIPMPLKIIGVQMGIKSDEDLWKIKISKHVLSLSKKLISSPISCD